MADPTKKPFGLHADEIRPIAIGRGSCFATDLITSGGRKVGFMYREQPDRDMDSGWRFMAAIESDDYMNDPNNHGLYDVNTIANYDPDIVPFLDAPVGSTFERRGGIGPFIAVDNFEPPLE